METEFQKGKPFMCVTVGTEDWEITVGVAVEVDVTMGGALVVITVGNTVGDTLGVTVGRIVVITVGAVMVIAVGDCVIVVRTGAWWGGLSAKGGQTQ